MGGEFVERLGSEAADGLAAVARRDHNPGGAEAADVP